MRKVLIFGNSGSGKSTLAKAISRSESLSHLDLDTLAWKEEMPPERRSLSESSLEISGFMNTYNGWVIEGCYADLLEVALPFSNEIIFMDLPIALCIENARNRPWEPHKYSSKAAQDKNLNMLINWISQYSDRKDTFSKSAHEHLFNSFTGVKKRVIENQSVNELYNPINIKKEG